MLNKIIVFCCLVSAASVSGADFLVKAGMNSSWFDTEGGTSEIGAAGGIGWEFFFNAEKSIGLGVDLLYVAEKMNLKDRTWLEGQWNENECEIGSANYYLHYSYVKIPFCLSYAFLKTKKITYKMKIGYSENFTVASHSDSKWHFITVKNCEYEYDYDRIINADSHAKYPNELFFGLELIYKKIMIDISYAYTLSKTERMYGLNIQDNIHSIRLLAAWRTNFTQ